MAGLNYAFFLVRTSEHAPRDYGHFTPLPGEVELHDDLLHYMGDSLRWIPTHNPALDEPCTGLCMYGPTVIFAEGARVAAAVFSTWARLFALGPSVLDLTGPYTWTGDDPANGAFERIRVERDDLCGRLSDLAGWAQQVAEGSGDLYLLHYGI
jgi:hypothetical protein